MTDDKTKKTADAPRHSDEKGVNPTGAGPAQPRKPNDDQPGATASASDPR